MIETNGQEVAHGIDKLLDDLTVKSERFHANVGKLGVQFNHRKRLMKVKAETKGNFVVEFEVDMKEFAKSPEEAFTGIRDSVSEVMFAGLQRRHSERQTLAQVMRNMQELPT